MDSKLKPVGVAFNLRGEADQLLTESARLNNRSKKQEAELRLADHLMKYETIGSVGFKKAR